MMDETTKTMFRNMQEQSLVDGAARIIDQYAFRSAFGAAMQTRQRIARNKARMILADANGARETLLDELVGAHKQIDELIALIKETGQLEITSSELWSGIGRRAALLARHGRLVS